MHGDESPPFVNFLIVNDDLRLGKKSDEAILYSEFVCDFTSIFGAATAPAKEFRAVALQVANV